MQFWWRQERGGVLGDRWGGSWELLVCLSLSVLSRWTVQRLACCSRSRPERYIYTHMGVGNSKMLLCTRAMENDTPHCLMWSSRLRMWLSVRLPLAMYVSWSRLSACKIRFRNNTSPIRRRRWSSSRTRLVGSRGSMGGFLLPRCRFGWEKWQFAVRAARVLALPFGGGEEYTASVTDMSHLNFKKVIFIYGAHFPVFYLSSLLTVHQRHA